MGESWLIPLPLMAALVALIVGLVDPRDALPEADEDTPGATSHGRGL